MAVDYSIPFWPVKLMPRTIERGRVHPVNFGPEPLSGPPQGVAADAGRLRFVYKGIPLYGDNIRLFRSVIATLAGSYSPVYVPVADWMQTPRNRAGLSQPGAVPYSDTATFSDGSRFLDQAIDFVLATSASMRAGEIMVSKIGPSALTLDGGNYIGIGDRVYIVKGVYPSDTIANLFQVTIWPLLRETMDVNTPVWTESPFVRCLLSSNSLEAAETLDLNIKGYVDVEFIEARWS